MSNTKVPEPSDMPRRDALVSGLRDFANFIVAHPDAPIPLSIYGGVHITDSDQFDEFLGRHDFTLRDTVSSEYEIAELRFGPVVYSVQTDGGVMRRVKRREAAVAAREAELGIAA